MHTKTGGESEISVCSKIMYRKNSANINELINRFELNDDFGNEHVKFVKVGKEKEKIFAFKGSEMDRSVMKFQRDEEYPKKRGRSWNAKKMTQQKIANGLSVGYNFLNNFKNISNICHNLEIFKNIPNYYLIILSYGRLKLNVPNEC